MTGRRAENLFLENCESWIGIPRPKVLDRRDSALGYDFAVAGLPERAIEVKGLKGYSGAIQFTDREWSEAKARGEEYWLVVVGNITTTPVFGFWKDPQRVLSGNAGTSEALPQCGLPELRAGLIISDDLQRSNCRRNRALLKPCGVTDLQEPRLGLNL